MHRLSRRDRDEMWTLFAAMYDDVERGRFDADLDAKRHVILLRDGGIKGFSTADHRVMRHGGRRFLVLYSGDTVLHRDLWGSRALQSAFGRYMIRTRLRRPWLPAYWLLVSKGYKTYLLLTRNFPVHWPRHDRATPAWVDGAMTAAASAWFPEADVQGGIVRHPVPAGRLRHGAVEPPRPDALDATFFEARNPGHAVGDELVCFGRMDWSIWARYLIKGVRRSFGTR